MDGDLRVRFVWAVVAFILAAVCIAGGIAQRTVFMGPDTQRADIAVSEDLPYLLVDGAVSNNLPISVARALAAGVVVAVGLCHPPRQVPRDILSVLVAAGDELLLRAGDPPASADVYLPIPVGGMGSLLRLSRAPEMVALGRQAAETALPAIREALASVAAPLWGHGEPV